MTGSMSEACTVRTFDKLNSGNVVIRTHTVIMATGGPGALFGSPLFPPEANAAPLYLAMLNGAKLVNLEFIQYGLVSPQTKLAC